MKHAEPPNLDETVSGVVRILLARDDMTRQDLARALGYDSSTITRSMRGDRPWKLSDLAAMAELFDVPSELFLNSEILDAVTRPGDGTKLRAQATRQADQITRLLEQVGEMAAARKPTAVRVRRAAGRSR